MEHSDGQIRETLATGKTTLTEEQQLRAYAESFPRFAFGYALQYYGMARFGLIAGFVPVAASVMHHAIEMFLKGCLAKNDSAPDIQAYKKTYSHRLHTMWAEVKRRNPASGLDQFDGVIAQLDRFSDVRYPDSLTTLGARIMTEFVEPAGSAAAAESDTRSFKLSVPPIDRLVKKLFEIADLNPPFFAMTLSNKHAAQYLGMYNDAPLVPPELESEAAPA